jgi:hypothetical protein
LLLVGVEFIRGSVKFSPRLVLNSNHACLGIARCRVYTRVVWFWFHHGLVQSCYMYALELVGFKLASVKFSPRQVTKLIQACFGSVRGRIHTRVGRILFSPSDVGTRMFWKGLV